MDATCTTVQSKIIYEASKWWNENQNTAPMSNFNNFGKYCNNVHGGDSIDCTTVGGVTTRKRCVEEL